MKEQLSSLASNATNRIEFWRDFINNFNCKDVVELGVYKGAFAEKVLRECNGISKYTMIDPWRNLSDWNRPSNKEVSVFEEFYQQVLERTSFAKEKITVLRGKTTEVISNVEKESLDFAYIDGDHTLKGIAIDLINIWDKMKPMGFIAGDDFRPSIVDNRIEFEPVMVFPFAVYFAEAVNAKIYALPFRQFLIVKEQSGFEVIDLTNGLYRNTDLRFQLIKAAKAFTLTGRLKLTLSKKFPKIYKMSRKFLGK